MLTPAIRLAARKGSTATIQLLCHVKPGVSAQREGVAAVTDDNIQVCVAAQARDGEANRAVRHVIAHALQVPKSDVDIVKGMKSREKVVVVSVTTKNQDGVEDVIARIKNNLLGSVSSR